MLSLSLPKSVTPAVAFLSDHPWKPQIHVPLVTTSSTDDQVGKQWAVVGKILPVLSEGKMGSGFEHERPHYEGARV
jgi:hypothetical protein